jgi:hypothetical protein
MSNIFQLNKEQREESRFQKFVNDNDDEINKEKDNTSFSLRKDRRLTLLNKRRMLNDSDKYILSENYV